MRNIAIVLAGGNGSRMNSNIPKQYMEIAGKTVLHYSLQQFEDCPFIDEIILVTRKEDIDYCKDTYRMSKITHIVEGGKERYESVMNGLDLVEDEGYVYIHDGARPCITEELLDRLYDDVKLHRATVLAVRSKDTVRISDDKGNAVITPNRDNVWLIQTPQVFDISLIKQAYYNLKRYGTCKNITDDAMVVEEFTKEKIHLTPGDYSNIKVTTKEDFRGVTDYIKKNEKKLLTYKNHYGSITTVVGERHEIKEFWRGTEVVITGRS